MYLLSHYMYRTAGNLLHRRAERTMMKSPIAASVVDRLTSLRRAALPALSAIIGVCVLSISSAKAAVIAQWNLDAGSQTASTVDGTFLSAASSLTVTPNTSVSLAFPTINGNPNGYAELTGKLNTLGNSTVGFSITAN